MSKVWESATWLPGYEAAWHATRTYSMARQVSMRILALSRTKVMPLYTNSTVLRYHASLSPKSDCCAKKIKLSQGLL